MPRKYVKGKKYKKPSKKLYKKRYTNPSVGKLLDNKVNTLLEKKMQYLAKKEVEKNQKVKIRRNYIFHNYNPALNVFTDLDPDVSKIDWKGRVVRLDNKIQKSDVEFLQNAQAIDDPLTGEAENMNGGAVGRGMVDKDTDGTRDTEQIYIKAVSAKIRIRVPSVEEGTDPDDVQHVTVKYAFVIVRQETPNAPAIPKADEILKFLSWGYTSQIDRSEEHNTNRLKYRTLCHGKCKIRYSHDRGQEKFRNIYRRMSRPIAINYLPDDQTGESANKNLYFVCRSTMPTSQSYNELKPKLNVVSKVYYFE